jgi:hypothetical protein
LKKNTTTTAKSYYLKSRISARAYSRSKFIFIGKFGDFYKIKKNFCKIAKFDESIGDNFENTEFLFSKMISSKLVESCTV